MNIDLSAPDITDREIEAVVSVLRGDRLSLGPWMTEFERSVAAWVKVPHGVAVSSGTAGLHLCLVALGIGPGDEVIVPSFTFIAVANAVRYVGATPVFVDIDAATLNMDPRRVEEVRTSRTKALLVVHTFGRTAPMAPLLAIAERHGLRVIEDACEALGATYRGDQAGSFGDTAVFGFYPNKQITTGEGGMVVTRDTRLADDLRALRNQGRYAGDEWHQHTLFGFNYRLSEMQCALGATQMSRLEQILATRERVAERYMSLLRDDSRVELPVAPEAGCTVSWFVFVLRLKIGFDKGTRDRIAARMASDGVSIGRYFAPIHQQPAYAGHRLAQPLPVTERESLRTLALPFATRLSDEQVDGVVGSLRRAMDEEIG